MDGATLPGVETLQFGAYLLQKRLISGEQLRAALSTQKHRPFLHLGEILCLEQVLSLADLPPLLDAYYREARWGCSLMAKGALSLEDFGAALDVQVETGDALDEVLVRQGTVSRQELLVAQAEPPGDALGSKDLFDKLPHCPQVNAFKAAAAKGRYPFFQPLSGPETPRTQWNGHEVVLLAANSYLGLSNDQSVIEASVAATRKYGVGTSGSPMLNGTMDLHVALERELAEFMGVEACALFSTGFQTNLGVLSAMVGRGDWVLADSLAHASLHDGCRLGFGEFRRFDHNNLAHLEQLLGQAGVHGKLVVVDGVYSMDGDLADLPGIVRLCKRYGARLLVDDAHGFGVLGARGRGTAEYFGLRGSVDLTTLTFSKALGTIGGCVLGTAELVHYIKHRSRPYIFSATLPPGTVAATAQALDRLRSDPSLRARLSANVQFLRQGLLDLGYQLGSGNSHILPLLIGDDDLALKMGTELLAQGVMAGTVISPGVPAGHARLRLSVMATHTFDDLALALEVFERVGRDLGAISPAVVTSSKKGSPMLQIETLNTHEGTVLSLAGDLDTSAALELDARLVSIGASVEDALTIDLTHLNYLNSTGIRSFILLDKQLKARGKHFTFCGVTPRIFRIFRYCGLESYFSFESAPELTATVQAAGKGA